MVCNARWTKKLDDVIIQVKDFDSQIATKLTVPWKIRTNIIVLFEKEWFQNKRNQIRPTGQFSTWGNILKTLLLLKSSKMRKQCANCHFDPAFISQARDIAAESLLIEQHLVNGRKLRMVLNMGCQRNQNRAKSWEPYWQVQIQQRLLFSRRTMSILIIYAQKIRLVFKLISTCNWILIGQKQNLKIFPSQNYSNSRANWLIDRSKQILRSKEIIGQNFYPICPSQKEHFINQSRYSTHSVISGLLTPTIRFNDDLTYNEKRLGKIRVLKK